MLLFKLISAPSTWLGVHDRLQHTPSICLYRAHFVLFEQVFNQQLLNEHIYNSFDTKLVLLYLYANILAYEYNFVSHK